MLVTILLMLYGFPWATYEAHTECQCLLQCILEQDMFHRSLIACCLEIVIFSYHPPGEFQWVLHIFDIPPYHFYKVSQYKYIVIFNTSSDLYIRVIYLNIFISLFLILFPSSGDRGAGSGGRRSRQGGSEASEPCGGAGAGEPGLEREFPTLGEY